MGKLQKLVGRKFNSLHKKSGNLYNTLLFLYKFPDRFPDEK